MPEYPIAWQSYQSDSPAWSSQRLLNMYPIMGNEGTKSKVLLSATPGKSLFVDVGSGPIRGMLEFLGVIIVVSGEQAFRVESNGTVIPIVGVIPGTGPVTMASNGVFQIAVCAEPDGYIISPGGLTVTKITDADFGSVTSVTYMNSRFIWSLFSSARFIVSGLLDGFNYDALDFAEAEYKPDNLVRCFAHINQLYNFGVDTTEPWGRATGGGFPYTFINGTAMELGLAARNSVASQSSNMFWLSRDRQGSISVYATQGFSPTIISTDMVDRSLNNIDNIEDAVGFCYTQDGHYFYVLTVPGDVTWVYDATTQMWHERNEIFLDDWKVSAFAFVDNIRVVGDSRNGKLYTLDLDQYTDDGLKIEREIITPAFASSTGQFQAMNYLRIDVETGVGTLTLNPQIMLDWTDDGQTYSNQHFRDVGLTGDYSKRVQWPALGAFRSRIYRIRMTDPVKWRISGAYYFSSEAFQ